MAWELTTALLLLAGLVCLVAPIVLAELWLSDRIVPGIHVWNVDMGGLTRDQAVERLSSSFRYPSHLHPTLRYGDQAWQVGPAELGISVDAAATADSLFALGHQGNLVERLGEQVSILSNGRMVMPTFGADPGQGVMFLSRITQLFNRPSRSAELSVKEDLTVEILPSQSGREVDEEATREALAKLIMAMQGGEVNLVVRESQPVLTDLGAAQSTVQHILSGPLTLTAPDFEPWTIGQAELAQWLILQPTVGADGQPTLTVSLDSSQARRVAEEISAQLFRKPKDAKFRYEPSSGTVVPTRESVPGRSLDVTATVSLIEGAVLGEQRTVPLPLQAIRPAISTGDVPNIKALTLIGEGTTNYTGSTSARVKNIIVGATQFDGLLVSPGETFSFNRYLGEVSAAKGYEESIIIWGNQTKTDVGGGLCQVSSTAFRAAFWAGLPIVERYPHAFRVSYYEPPKGMDATIFSPWVDLKWANDTGDFILIRTQVDKVKRTVTFQLYGTSLGRAVEMEDPIESRLVHPDPPVYRDDPSLPKGQTRQIDWAKDGLDVTIVRIVKENGQEVRRDTFFSRYRPWQAVYLVGTKEG